MNTHTLTAGIVALILSLFGIVAFIVCGNCGWALDVLFNSEAYLLLGVFAILSILFDLAIGIKLIGASVKTDKPKV